MDQVITHLTEAGFFFKMQEEENGGLLQKETEILSMTLPD